MVHQDPHKLEQVQNEVALWTLVLLPLSRGEDGLVGVVEATAGRLQSLEREVVDEELQTSE